MAKCQYRGKDKIRAIEEKWIEQNIKDEVKKGKLKVLLNDILEELGNRADCKFDAVYKSSYCMFHDPNYWKRHKGRVYRRFTKLLGGSGDKVFVGFHLPSIKFPAVVNGNLTMPFTKFHGSIIASSTKFQGTADFRVAAFSGIAYFFNAELSQKTDFNGAEFSWAASFSRAKFSGEVNFRVAEFSRAAGFIAAEFSKKTDFSEVKFSGRADFHGAEFSEADFSEAKFSGRVSFDLARFSGRVSFEKSIFPQNLPVSLAGSQASSNLSTGHLDSGNMISFRRVIFENQQNVVFDETDMSMVSFINTDIDRVRFRNIKWGETLYDGRLLLIKNSRNECRKFIKERLMRVRTYLKRDKRRIEELKNKPNEAESASNQRIFDDLTLENVLSVYRSLRENHDYYLRYEEAGRFFVEEMRLKRRLLGKGEKLPLRDRISVWVQRLVMWIYELLPLYGESYVRPIIWSIAVIAISSLARPLLLQDLSPDFILGQLKTSLLVFFQLHSDPRVLTMAERLLSLPLLGLLIIALRRKLERRVRH